MIETGNYDPAKTHAAEVERLKEIADRHHKERTEERQELKSEIERLNQKLAGYESSLQDAANRLAHRNGRIKVQDQAIDAEIEWHRREIEHWKPPGSRPSVSIEALQRTKHLGRILLLEEAKGESREAESETPELLHRIYEWLKQQLDREEINVLAWQGECDDLLAEIDTVLKGGGDG